MRKYFNHNIKKKLLYFCYLAVSVRNLVMLNFCCFFCNFLALFDTLWLFLSFILLHFLVYLVIYAVLLRIYFCHNLHAFLGKLFLQKPCLCKRSVHVIICCRLYYSLVRPFFLLNLKNMWQRKIVFLALNCATKPIFKLQPYVVLQCDIHQKDHFIRKVDHLEPLKPFWMLCYIF